MHPLMLRTARQVAVPLAAAMRSVGPPAWPRRDDQPVARYLAQIVVGQQLSTRAAATIWQRIETLAHSRATAIPALALTGDLAALRACGLSADKLRCLQGLAAAEASGELQREPLAQLAPAARATRLTALRGVGPWSADMLALFYFRDPDIWPLGDLAVRKTFAHFLKDQPGVDLTAAAAVFAPRRSLLALYLWRIANTLSLA